MTLLPRTLLEVYLKTNEASPDRQGESQSPSAATPDGATMVFAEVWEPNFAGDAGLTTKN